MKFWTVTSDTDNGTKTDIFWDKAQAESALFAAMRDDWVDYIADGTPCPEDWRKAFERLTETLGYMDSYTLSEHPVPTIKTIYLLASDGKDGTQVHAFTNEGQRTRYIWDNFVELRDEETEEPIEDTNKKLAYMVDNRWDWTIPMEEGYWPEHLTISLDDFQVPADPDHGDILRGAHAEIGNLLDQIYQMRGMFSDEDSNIADAIDSAREFGAKITSVLEQTPARPEPSPVWAVTIHHNMEDNICGVFSSEELAIAHSNQCIKEAYLEQICSDPDKYPGDDKAEDALRDDDSIYWTISVDSWSVQTELEGGAK